MADAPKPLTRIEELLINELAESKSDLRSSLIKVGRRLKPLWLGACRNENDEASVKRKTFADVGKAYLDRAFSDDSPDADIVNAAYDEGHRQGVEDALTAVRAYLAGLN